MKWVAHGGARATDRDASLRFSPGWVVRKLDKAAMTACLKEETANHRQGPTETCKSKVDALVDTITRACDARIPRKRPQRGRIAVYWWTCVIAQLRRDCIRVRRRMQRARAKGEGREARSTEYRCVKKSMRDKIKASKAKCWEELLQAVEEDPWGPPYKLVTKKLAGLRQPEDPTIVEGVLGELFPTHGKTLSTTLGCNDEGPTEPFTEAELANAARRLGGGKVPGPVTVPKEALAVVAVCYPDTLLRAYNECLRSGAFPGRWKRQRVVLLPKGQAKNGELPPYRPIRPIDVSGKILERLLHARLEAAPDASGGLADNQYGFRRGRSTNQAIDKFVDIARKANERKGRFATPCLWALLAIKNVFNAVGHDVILEAIIKRKDMPAYLLGIFKSYLENRLLL
ncbi:uncharacterized protein [Neodiprion pinetum]|uniref:uncharacterized protein n=1 Tax=Neodiprion pinetum TaxID=441929 RepID=UPI00371DD57F